MDTDVNTDMAGTGTFRKWALTCSGLAWVLFLRVQSTQLLAAVKELKLGYPSSETILFGICLYKGNLY